MITSKTSALFFCAGLVLVGCGSPEPVQPTYIFPDEEKPTAFTRAFTLTESLDGNVRVFTRESRDETDLYELRKQEDGTWTEPVKLDWEKKRTNLNGHFSPFDGRLYFASDRDIPGREGRRDPNIWSVEVTEDGWGAPVPLEGDVNTGGREISVSTDAEGNMFFVSRGTRGPGGQDIFFATRDPETGAYTTVDLPEGINTARNEDHVAVTPDGQHFLFYSYKSPKLGVVDIVAVSKDENGEWFGPYNIGPLINTGPNRETGAEGIDFGPSFSADGSKFFFSRDGRLMSLPMDIFLEELREAREAAQAGEEEEHIGLPPKD